MSDEPRKRSRAWFLGALIALVVLAYPVALGPVGSRVLLSTPDYQEAPGRLGGIYAPVGWLCKHSDRARNVVLWYMAWWTKL
jgi:hypothetical protein